MTPHEMPAVQCSWTGVTDEGARAEPCGKPAIGYVENRNGGRVYCCAEHVESARARAGGGRFVHATREEDEVAPGTYYGASRQAHGNYVGAEEID
jgi:hypothetical protein